MAIPDAFNTGKMRALLRMRIRLSLGGRKRPRRPSGTAEGEPVEPRHPDTLSGGAAAALEFDD